MCLPLIILFFRLFSFFLAVSQWPWFKFVVIELKETLKLLKSRFISFTFVEQLSFENVNVPDASLFFSIFFLSSYFSQPWWKFTVIELKEILNFNHENRVSSVSTLFVEHLQHDRVKVSISIKRSTNDLLRTIFQRCWNSLASEFTRQDEEKSRKSSTLSAPAGCRARRGKMFLRTGGRPGTNR